MKIHMDVCFPQNLIIISYPICVCGLFSDLVLDLDILSDNNHRLRTGILSGEIPFIYQMS